MSEAINKKIKAQYNSLCSAAIFLEMNAIVLTAGKPALNLIDISDKGITIQTNPEKPINFMTDNLFGPYYQWNTNPYSLFAPMLGNANPRAKFHAPFSDNLSDLVGVTSVFAMISGV